MTRDTPFIGDDFGRQRDSGFLPYALNNGFHEAIDIMRFSDNVWLDVVFSKRRTCDRTDASNLAGFGELEP